MVADAQIRKVVRIPIHDVCLRMKIVTSVLKMIRVSHMEAIKEENWKSEWMIGLMSLLFMIVEIDDNT